MSTYLLTWNPRKSSNEYLLKAAVGWKHGSVLHDQWSCGNNEHIEVGSRVFLLRQGSNLPGIVASGWVTKGSFLHNHWDAAKGKRGIKARYVQVDWEDLVPPPNGLSRGKLLKGILPAKLLKSAASGVSVPPERVNRLERMWRVHVNHVIGESQSVKRSYWVVSPNVRNNEATVGAWRKASVLGHAAFMGWYPHDSGHGQLGPAFAGKTKNGIKPGDVILIARRHRFQPEIVGFGTVRGEFAKRINQIKTPETFGSLRRLHPFKPWTGLPPTEVPIMQAVRHTKALARLHPDRNVAHKKVCVWLDQQIDKRSAPINQNAGRVASKREPRASDIKIISSPENYQLDYKVQTHAKVMQAKKVEAVLVDGYRNWLAQQGRKISAVKYGSIQCDAYEPERRNLIEAKSSVRREHIRMAVGQLLDYAFQGRAKLGDCSKAILLPSEPSSEIVSWLDSLKIKIVWRQKGVFLDNANGQFT